jgi:hypothetical protein
MGLSYSSNVYLHNLNIFSPVLLITWAIAGTTFMVYYIEAIRVGFKHKTSGLPWQTNMYNFANDIIFVTGFTRWFSPHSATNHWIQQIWWAGMACWVFMELTVHYQAIKWDLPEIFPSIKKRSTAILVYWVAQICFIVTYAWLWSIIDDPFVIVMFTTTYLACVFFNLSFLANRKSRKGVSAGLVISLIVANVFYFFGAIPAMDPIMGNGFNWAMGAVCVGLSVAYAILWKRAPRYNPTT